MAKSTVKETPVPRADAAGKAVRSSVLDEGTKLSGLMCHLQGCLEDKSEKPEDVAGIVHDALVGVSPDVVKEVVAEMKKSAPCVYEIYRRNNEQNPGFAGVRKRD